MRATFLVTCGTSLLNNASRDINSKDISEQLRVRLSAINDRFNLANLARLEPGSLDDYKIKNNHAYKGSELFSVLLDYLKERGIRASAEVNTIELVRRGVLLTNKEIKVYLYRSDTGTGTLTARVIEEYLRENGIDTEDIEVKGFGTSKTLEQFQEGMIDLLTKIIRIVKSKKRDDNMVYVLATGGFKPESTAAVIASLLAHADGVYYVYEGNRELVSIPAIPLSISNNIIEHLKKIFNEQDEVTIDSIYQSRGEEELSTLESKGLIERVGELRDRVRLREWVRELIE